MCSGNRVQGLGFRFRDQGLGIRVSGVGFRGSGFGLRVSGFGFRVSGFGFVVCGFGCVAMPRVLSGHATQKNVKTCSRRLPASTLERWRSLFTCGILKPCTRIT